MRYVTYPPDEAILEAEPVGDPPKPPVFSLRMIVIYDLGSSLSWRADEASMASYLVFCDLFKAPKAGDVVPMTDDDHERLVASFRAYPSFQPGMIPYVMRLFMPVMTAAKKAPEAKPPAESPPPVAERSKP